MDKQTRDGLFDDGLMSVGDAEAFTGLGRSKLYEMMARGELIYSKFGAARRIPRRALVELAKANAQGGWKRDENGGAA